MRLVLPQRPRKLVYLDSLDIWKGVYPIQLHQYLVSDGDTMEGLMSDEVVPQEMRLVCNKISLTGPATWLACMTT